MTVEQIIVYSLLDFFALTGAYIFYLVMLEKKRRGIAGSGSAERKFT